MTIVMAVLAFLGGIGGPIVGVLMIPATRRKVASENTLTNANAADVLSEAAMDILKPAQEQVAWLSTRLAQAEKRAEELSVRLQETLKDMNDLRHDVLQLTRDLAVAQTENERLRNLHG